MIVLRAVAAHGGYVSIYDEPYHPINTWPTFIANLFLVQAWNIFPYLSWNGAAWFVSVEFLLCLLVSGLSRDRARRMAGSGGADRWPAARRSQCSRPLRNTASISPSITASIAAWPRSGSVWALPSFIGSRSTVARTGFPPSRSPPRRSRCVGLLLIGIYDTGWSHRPEDIYTVLPMMALVFVLSFDRGIVASALQTRSRPEAGRMVLRDLYRPDGTPPVAASCATASLSRAGDMVFGRPWAAWEPIWHWLEPTLLVTAAVLWGWILFTAIEKPASAALRRYFAGASSRGAASA